MAGGALLRFYFTREKIDNAQVGQWEMSRKSKRATDGWKYENSPTAQTVGISGERQRSPADGEEEETEGESPSMVVRDSSNSLFPFWANKRSRGHVWHVMFLQTLVCIFSMERS